jgi:hypothetical protein
LLVSWLLAADQAWRSVSQGRLPMPLLRALQAKEKIDETKLTACLERLRGSGSSTRRLPSVLVARTEAAVRAYHPERDGMLPAGTRVRHALHGTGTILRFGSENSLAYMEIAFDKGRTVRLLLQHASIDVME